MCIVVVPQRKESFLCHPIAEVGAWFCQLHFHTSANSWSVNQYLCFGHHIVCANLAPMSTPMPWLLSSHLHVNNGEDFSCSKKPTGIRLVELTFENQQAYIILKMAVAYGCSVVRYLYSILALFFTWGFRATNSLTQYNKKFCIKSAFYIIVARKTITNTLEE